MIRDGLLALALCALLAAYLAQDQLAGLVVDSPKTFPSDAERLALSDDQFCAVQLDKRPVFICQQPNRAQRFLDELDEGTQRSHLTHISINSLPHLRENVVRTVARAVTEGRLPCLRELALRDLALSSDDAGVLAQALGRGAPRVLELQLSGNGIGDAGAAALARSISELPVARAVRLLRNPDLGVAGVERLIAALQSRGGVVELSLALFAAEQREQLEAAAQGTRLRFTEEPSVSQSDFWFPRRP